MDALISGFSEVPGSGTQESSWRISFLKFVHPNMCIFSYLNALVPLSPVLSSKSVTFSCLGTK